MAGEESPPAERGREREREKKIKNNLTDVRGRGIHFTGVSCLSVILHKSARILHQCNGQKNHTTRGMQ